MAYLSSSPSLRCFKANNVIGFSEGRQKDVMKTATATQQRLSKSDHQPCRTTGTTTESCLRTNQKNNKTPIDIIHIAYLLASLPYKTGVLATGKWQQQFNQPVCWSTVTKPLLKWCLAERAGPDRSSTSICCMCFKNLPSGGGDLPFGVLNR